MKSYNYSSMVNKSALMLKTGNGLKVNEIFFAMLYSYTKIISNLSEKISSTILLYMIRNQ